MTTAAAAAAAPVDALLTDFLDELCEESASGSTFKSSSSTARRRIVRIPPELDLLPPRPTVFSCWNGNENDDTQRRCCWVDCGNSSKTFTEIQNSVGEKDDMEQHSVTSATSVTSRDDDEIDDDDNDLTSIPDMTMDETDDKPTVAATSKPSHSLQLHLHRPLLENASHLVLGVCQMLLAMWMVNHANILERALQKKKKTPRREQSS